MISVVMVVEGVLRHPESDGHYDTGWALYQSLAKNTRLYLLSARWNEEDLNHWLVPRRLTGHLAFLKAHADGPAGRLEALERIRSWRIALVIEPDPTCAAVELGAGFTTLLHSHATYTQPRWRPDYDGTPRPWDQLTEAIEHQTRLRLEDPRNATEPT